MKGMQTGMNMHSNGPLHFNSPEFLKYRIYNRGSGNEQYGEMGGSGWGYGVTPVG